MEIEIDPQTYIREQFESHGIFYRSLKHDFAIDCPYRPSESGQQKMMVSFDGLKIHCWSCGASGSYNTLADRMGLRRLPRAAGLAYRSIDESLAELQKVQGRVTVPPGVDPWKGDYRGLSEEFMRRFDSSRWFDTKNNAYRILWPVRQNARLQGWVAGALSTDVLPKYRNGPEGVFKAKTALWPIDDPMVKRNVVLVEGPFDALRLLNAGIPAVSILGTGAWSAAKLTVLEQRSRPVRGVIVAMDGDDEGWRANKLVYAAARDRFEVVEVFECPKDRDPGNMSDRWVESLRGVLRDVRRRTKRPVENKRANV